jgi:hypothetical protein
MRALTKKQNRALGSLSIQVKVIGEIINEMTYDSDGIDLELLAIHTNDLLQNTAGIQDFAINMAFQAVHNNQKQEA